MLNKEAPDSSLARRSSLWSVMDLGTSLFKRGYRGGGGILVVDLCPRAPSLRRRLLQRRRGAWEVVQERMQIVVCIDDIWKTERVLGLWLMDGRYGFLLRRLSRGGAPDLEFDGVSRCCPGLIRSTAMASSLASHLGGPQSCISAMEPRRARVRR
jgi:hypothetical protein